MSRRKKRMPPKHLKRPKYQWMPARPKERLETQRIRRLKAQKAIEEPSQDYEPQHQAEHRDYDKVAETPDNTKLFYDKLLPLAKSNHAKNKRFLRVGVIWLFALPVILFIIRNMTSGNKIAFLIAWIIGMFIIASALIIIAYQDELLQKNLDELQEYVPDVETNQLGKLKIVSAEDLKMIAPGSMDAIVQEALAERAEFEKRMAALKSLRVEHSQFESEPRAQKNQGITLELDDYETLNPPQTGRTWFTDDTQRMWQQMDELSPENKGGGKNE